MMIVSRATMSVFVALAPAIFGGSAFSTTILNNVPVGQYEEHINYAPPCCVLSTIKQSILAGQVTASRSGGSGSSTYEGGGTAQAMVGWAPTIPLQLDPFVTASAHDSVTGEFEYPPAFEVGASMTYYLDITSISIVPSQLPNDVLHFQVHGSTITEGPASAQASMTLGGNTFGSLNINSSTGTSNSKAFDFNSYLTLDTNTVYAVTIRVGANVYGAFGANDSSNSADAIVDPVFSIAAPYQSEYQIDLSPDLIALAGPPPTTSIPEPRVSWLAACFLSALGLSRASSRVLRKRAFRNSTFASE